MAIRLTKEEIEESERLHRRNQLDNWGYGLFWAAVVLVIVVVSITSC